MISLFLYIKQDNYHKIKVNNDQFVDKFDKRRQTSFKI